MSFVIRPALPSDAQQIHDAHMKSILEVCGPDHTEEQLNAWGRRPFNLERRVYGIEHDKVWVVEQDGVVEGFTHITFFYRNGKREGHLWGLYITPKVLKKGVGRALFEKVIADARQEGADRFDFSSSVTSHEFYKKMGCRDIPGQLLLKIGGVDLPSFPMEYWVQNAPPQIRLEKPSLKYVNSFARAMDEYIKEGRYDEDDFGVDLNELKKDWGPKIQEWANSETHPAPKKVPELYLWAIENEKYVGRISLRLSLTDSLKQFGGHVGYEVAVGARGRGIASEMLRQLILFHQTKKIRSLLITCAEDNYASEKVMFKNGAVRVPGLVWLEEEKRNLKHFTLNTTVHPSFESSRLLMDRILQSDVSSMFEYASG